MGESNQNGHKNEETELSPLEMAKKMQQKNDKEKQTEILLKFSNQTNLTLERADECLKKVNWDYDAAINMLQSLMNEGKIPRDYFKSLIVFLVFKKPIHFEKKTMNRKNENKNKKTQKTCS